MGGEESSSPSHRWSTSIPPAPAPESSSERRTAGAPVSVLVFLHKAIRGELDELWRVATDAASESGVQRRESLLVGLRRRLEFFRSVYRYHCAAEDEVFFLALSAYVKNVACTYFLEHHIIDSTFESIFSCLNGTKEDQGNSCQEFQELVFHIGTLRDSICQHMVKEEQQVFPLLTSQFSDEEQAFLVWQFICSVPVMLMEDLLPWLVCFLSPDEQLDLKHCIRKIVPQDKSLQEVVISWMEKTTQPLSGGSVTYDTPSGSRDEPDNLNDVSERCLLDPSSSKSCQWKDLQINVRDSPLDGLLLWHAAIKSDFKDILDKLYQIRSKKFSSLASVIVRINFLIDVLIFYSNALERTLYPLLEDASVLQLSPSYKAFPQENEIEGLKKILNDANQITLANPRFLGALCSKVEGLVLATSEHLSFQETKVFPLISKNCGQETQQKLLFKCLRMLPLGLLKCVASWFSSHLTKDMLKSILRGIEQSYFLAKPFASLLHEWIRTGYSGKTTMEDLQEMFDSRVSYMSGQLREGKDPYKTQKHAMIKHSPLDSSRSFLSHSLSRCFHLIKKHGTLYSSGVNLLMFSSRASNLVYSFPGSPTEPVSINHLEPRPMDHIYYFHKAIKKDLESLVLDTTKLSENLGLLVDFSQRFHLVRSLYELHSQTEDEVAFPALEAKQKLRNLTLSYSIDHNLEAECFNRVSGILEEMSELYHSVSGAAVDPELLKYRQLCLKLQDSCKSLEKILNDHIRREEIELWPLFREYFSTEEQEKIVGYMLGRTRPEILQKMIVWLMACLTSEEQQAIMTFWRKATKYTKFDEWLGEWWEGMESYVFSEAEELDISISSAKDSREIVIKYLSTDDSHDQERNFYDENVKLPHDDSRATNMVKKSCGLDTDDQKHKSFECTRLFSDKKEKHRRKENLIDAVCERRQLSQLAQQLHDQNTHLTMSQVELEAAIRKVSQDSSLDLQAKSRIIQNLMTSHWVAAQSLPDSNSVITSESGKLPGQFPSYRDPGGSVFGCNHYKQNCKLLAACCKQLFTCRRCHEEVADHLMDRKSTTQMMCMKCLEIQAIGQTCSTPSCNNYSMAKYYCRICRLFDDEREIYHCPYCNLCRVGKGLGIDYFHCMKCNACMSRSLSVHICREKCIEDKCPICHEDMFTSSIPLKALACGHLMHSTCFQDYTCMRYTCPVCSKSLGDMQVYFEMLDTLLAEEKMPEEYSSQTQAILCNDCEKKGTAPFHWLHHKCPFCGSYNTRLL